MIVVLTVILLILLLVIGGIRGLRSALSILINFIIMMAYIMAVAHGFPFWFCSIFAGIGFVMVTLLYQMGWNEKTWIAGLTSGLVLMFVGGLVYWFVQGSRLAGLNEVEISMDISNAVTANVHLDMSDMTVVVFLFGTLGAVIDTAVAIASAVYEIHRNNKDLSFRRLFIAGNHVGRDILGTTVNTLCFAGLGESLMVSLFLWIHDFSFARLVNSEAVFQEFSIIFIGSLGCLLVIPLTTVLASLYFHFAQSEMQENA